MGLTLKALMVSLCLQFTLNFKIRRGTQFKRQVDLGSAISPILIIATTMKTSEITCAIGYGKFRKEQMRQKIFVDPNAVAVVAIITVHKVDKNCL